MAKNSFVAEVNFNLFQANVPFMLKPGGWFAR